MRADMIQQFTTLPYGVIELVGEPVERPYMPTYSNLDQKSGCDWCRTMDTAVGELPDGSMICETCIDRNFFTSEELEAEHVSTRV